MVKKLNVLKIKVNILNNQEVIMINKIKENKEQDKIDKELLDFEYVEPEQQEQIEQLDLYVDKEYDKYDKTFKKIIDEDENFSFKDNEEK